MPSFVQTIRELRSDNEELRKRFSGEDTVAEQNVRNEYEKQLEDALTQNSQLERLNEGKVASVADVLYRK